MARILPILPKSCVEPPCGRGGVNAGVRADSIPHQRLIDGDIIAKYNNMPVLSPTTEGYSQWGKTPHCRCVRMPPCREDGAKARRKEYSAASIDISHTFLSYEYEFPGRLFPVESGGSV